MKGYNGSIRELTIYTPSNPIKSWIFINIQNIRAQKELKSTFFLFCYAQVQIINLKKKCDHFGFPLHPHVETLIKIILLNCVWSFSYCQVMFVILIPAIRQTSNQKDSSSSPVPHP